MQVRKKREKNTNTKKVIYENYKHSSKKIIKELKEIEKINKARLALGLSLLKMKTVKCLRCDREITTIGRYRCLMCDEHIEKFNLFEGYG